MASIGGVVPREERLEQLRQGAPVHYEEDPVLITDDNLVDPTGTFRETVFADVDGLSAFADGLNKPLETTKFQSTSKKNGTYRVEVLRRLRVLNSPYNLAKGFLIRAAKSIMRDLACRAVGESAPELDAATACQLRRLPECLTADMEITSASLFDDAFGLAGNTEASTPSLIAAFSDVAVASSRSEMLNQVKQAALLLKLLQVRTARLHVIA